MAVLFAAGMATAAISYLVGLAAVVAGLLVVGFAIGVWDVALNVEGAAVGVCDFPSGDDGRALVLPGVAGPPREGARSAAACPNSHHRGALVRLRACLTGCICRRPVVGRGDISRLSRRDERGADDPHLAPGRLSVIAPIGYCAFLAGPPFVGFLGDHLTVLLAVTTVALLLALALALVGALRAPVPSTTVST